MWIVRLALKHRYTLVVMALSQVTSVVQAIRALSSIVAMTSAAAYKWS